MNPNSEFEAWYQKAIGITVEEARRRGVYDLEILQQAFMAGRYSGRLAMNKAIPPETLLYWETTLKEKA